MDRSEVERILSEEPDVERAKARIDALLETERLNLERERSTREEHRLEREKRRWYANPLFVAVSVGVLALVGDLIVSTVQGRQDLFLQRDKANSDLIVSLFSDNAEQSIDNLKFMIEAGLVSDPDNLLVAAAERFRPRSATAAAPKPSYEWGRVSPPVQFNGIVFSRSEDRMHGIEKGLFGVLLRGSPAFPNGFRPLVSPSQTVGVRLAGVRLASRITRGCSESQVSGTHRLIDLAHEKIDSFLDANNDEVKVYAVSVDSLGNVVGVIVPKTAEGDITKVFSESLNAKLLEAGLASQQGYSSSIAHDRSVWRLSYASAVKAAKRQQGMFSEEAMSFDLADDNTAPVSPWLAYHACRSKESGKPFMEYLKGAISIWQITETGTGNVIELNELIAVQGTRLTLLKSHETWDLTPHPKGQ